jgi:hypothetical protein
LLDGTWNRQVVNSRDVFAHEFGAHGRGEIAQVAGDHLARARPGRIAVREVVGPHAVVFAPPRENVTADSVVEERGIYLLVEVFARWFSYGQSFAVGP